MPVEIARAIGVGKSFGGVRALAEVDVDILVGEVHALCGENGAGKSTLIKILSGFLSPDEGKVLIAGTELPPSVHAASELGVAVIYQESMACADLDAVDNIFVGRELRRAGGWLLHRAAMERQASELLAQLGESIDASRPVGELPLAQRQMIGIARALSQRCRLLIMDEPTASLSARETETLFRIIRTLRAQGVSILYVSHRLEEVFALADRVTVLRDGRRVATRPMEGLTTARLVGLMVGREIEPIEGGAAPPVDSQRSAVLEVRQLTRLGSFEDISLSLQAGEVVGLAGLVGAGRSEVAGAIFGVAPYDSGTVQIDGKPLEPGSVAASIQGGLAFVPEDRQHLGLILPMTVAQNLSLTILKSLSRWGLIRKRAERLVTTRLAEELQVRAARLTLPAEALSGGNQQKLALGKWLSAKPRVLILDEPTRGVDVAAKAQIHRRIRQLASQGMAALVISSELPEILRLSDRVLVMREGRLVGKLTREQSTEEKVLQLMLPVGYSGEVDRRAPANSIATRPWSWKWMLRRRELWLAAMLCGTVACVGALKPSFLSPANLLDIVAEAAPTAIVACAVTFVIVSGEIDISVGSVAGLTAALLGIWSYGADPLMPVPAGVACSLLVALGVGALNGLLVTVGRVPSIIATLAMLTVLRGVTKLIMQGNSIEGRPDSLRDLATGRLLGIPGSVYLAAVIAGAFAVAARRTPFGRRVYAVGSNPQAAPLLGVSVGFTKFVVFSLAGLMAGLASIVLAPKNSIIQPNLGEGLELLVITCVVVGGTSIRGGRGTIAGTVLAVLLLSLVPTALTYIGAPPQWRLAIQGAFILAAVLADHFMHEREPRGSFL
jgi:ABC-type sugar transport system ATPase subunit/ribose/xylose/arabinose/galactoside ABC-type transport system permease subunit